jgi:tRNA uridine 5-carboxymethylaminomethyl modification enzyme
MYGGHIEGVGPRYCPSIEDKVVRFADKESHQIFLEPEGSTTDTVYPNGISTSLPEEVQEAYVRSIRDSSGRDPAARLCHRIRLRRSARLRRRWRCATCRACSLRVRSTARPATRRPRHRVWWPVSTRALKSLGWTRRSSPRDSYIGVMIDDLTTRGVSEPYRMFTSRAEFRLPCGPTTPTSA